MVMLALKDMYFSYKIIAGWLLIPPNLKGSRAVTGVQREGKSVPNVPHVYHTRCSVDYLRKLSKVILAN